MERGESLVFPVSLDLPGELEVGGRVWLRRPELHVTTFTPHDLADALDLDEAVLLAVGEDHRDELERVRPVRFDGRVARVEREDGRRTLVAFCDVDVLGDVYRRLSAAVGRRVALPPTHVTLFTAEPGMRGIGLSTAEQVEAYATALAGAEARTVLRHLPR